MNPQNTDKGRQQWFRSLNCDGSYGLAWLLLCAVLTALAAGGPRPAGAAGALAVSRRGNWL
jgi:hypothetical protein